MTATSSEVVLLDKARSKLKKKDYYPVFKLAGFTGFDGNFK